MELPAGLTDKNVEIFVKDDEIFAIHNGKVLPFDYLPTEIVELFMDDMLHNTGAVFCLHKMGMKNINDMLRQYVKCRFGGLDKRADLDTTRKDINPDYWDCGKRDSCPYQFAICDRVRVGDIYLTIKQIEVVKHIAAGLTDKETAVRLNISIDTLHTHTKNIHYKLGVHSQSEVTTFALRNNLIQ